MDNQFPCSISPSGTARSRVAGKNFCDRQCYAFKHVESRNRIIAGNILDNVVEVFLCLG